MHFIGLLLKYAISLGVVEISRVINIIENYSSEEFHSLSITNNYKSTIRDTTY